VALKGRKPERRAIGGGGARNPRSLENLKAAPPAPERNARALTHGGHRRIPPHDLRPEVAEVFNWLAALAPLRDADGGLPAPDAAAVEVAAERLKRWRSMVVYNDAHGRIQERTGEVKGAARFELECERALDRSLSALGLTPDARVRIGVNLATGERTLAELMAEDAQREEAEGG
jgi:hypothetical protein